MSELLAEEDAVSQKRKQKERKKAAQAAKKKAAQAEASGSGSHLPEAAEPNPSGSLGPLTADPTLDPIPDPIPGPTPDPTPDSTRNRVLEAGPSADASPSGRQYGAVAPDEGSEGGSGRGSEGVSVRASMAGSAGVPGPFLDRPMGDVLRPNPDDKTGCPLGQEPGAAAAPEVEKGAGLGCSGMHALLTCPLSKVNIE